MANDNHKAYVQGSEFPPLKDGILRIYSHRFCPFAQRTRMLAIHKKIPHEVVNVHLRQKPDWFLSRTPLGLVPVVEYKGKIVYDSLICNDYLDEVFSDPKLKPDDPYTRAEMRMFIERFNKVTASYNAIRRAENEKDRNEELKNAQLALESFEQYITGKYFGGKDLGILDFAIWPFVERFCLIEQLIPGVRTISPERFPKLTAWVSAMKETDAVKKTEKLPELHLVYAKSITAGVPNYNAGL